MIQHIQDYRFRFYLFTRSNRWKNKLAWAIAFRLPERIVYFVGIRMAAKVTDKNPFFMKYEDVLHNYTDGEDY